MTLKQWLTVDAPAGWGGVFARTVTMSLVGFVVLQVKEWSETGAFDTPDALIGAGWFAGATVVVSTLLKLLKS
jgi:hypothetical protein